MHEKGRLLLCLFCSLSTRGKEEETAKGAEGGVGRAVGGSVVQEGEARGGRERQKEGWSHVEKTVLWQQSNQHA